jgi:hypothetical protein
VRSAARAGARDVGADDAGLDRFGALEGVDGPDAGYVPDDMGERNDSFRFFFFFLYRDGPR